MSLSLRGSEPHPDAWRTYDGGVLRVGVRIRKPISAALALLLAAALFAGAASFFTFASPTIGKWVFSGLCLLMGLGALHGVLWLGFGSCELTISSNEFVLRRRAGPLVYTKRMAASDVRKVERVEQINTRNGKRLATVFHVFGRYRRWRFGETLSLPAADHLWADLSRGWKSSTRIENVDPSAD